MGNMRMVSNVILAVIVCSFVYALIFNEGREKGFDEGKAEACEDVTPVECDFNMCGTKEQKISFYLSGGSIDDN